jgi:hypothetical protein
MPFSLLSLGAVGFGLAHNEASIIINQYSGTLLSADYLKLVLFRFPLALHTGWLAAAALLNFNGWLAVSNQSIALQTSAAFISTFIASLAGGFLSIRSNDPFIALTIAWALAALSTKTFKRKQDLVSIDTQFALAQTESFFSKIMIGTAIGIVSKPAWSKLF